MKYIVVVATIALTSCTSVNPTQTVSPEPEASTPAAGRPPASDGLAELDAMTFRCPKAGLNAAAREAAKVRSQGTYQFSYFRILSDSHHSAYEVHFKSNYYGEPDLKYCVSIYCQQGWDPTTSKTTVRLMNDAPQPTSASTAGPAQTVDCGDQRPPEKHPMK